jgi:hypothetical protein
MFRMHIRDVKTLDLTPPSGPEQAIRPEADSSTVS